MDWPIILPPNKTYALCVDGNPSWSTFDLFICINYRQHGEMKEYFFTITAAEIQSMPYWKVFLSDMEIISIELTTSALVFSPGQPTNICLYLARYYASGFRQVATIYSGPISGESPVLLPWFPLQLETMMAGVANVQPGVNIDPMNIQFTISPPTGTIRILGFKCLIITAAAGTARYPIFYGGAVANPYFISRLTTGINGGWNVPCITSNDANASSINTFLVSWGWTPTLLPASLVFTLSILNSSPGDQVINGELQFQHFPARWNAI